MNFRLTMYIYRDRKNHNDLHIKKSSSGEITTYVFKNEILFWTLPQYV